MLNRTHVVIILLVLLLVDVSLIVVHMYAGHLLIFNLDRESNVPTLYQGLKLLTFGYFFIFCVLCNRTIRRGPFVHFTFWSMAALLLIWIGVDELAVIHETIPTILFELNPHAVAALTYAKTALWYDGALWVLYYFPMIVLAVLPALVFQVVYIARSAGWYVFIFVLGVTMLLSVPFIEMINTTGSMSLAVYEVWMMLEEGLEMIGVSLVAVSYLLVSVSTKALISDH